MSFPQLSHVDDFVRQTLDNRKNNILGNSKLNCWVRLFSGRATDDSSQNGMVLYTNTDYQLFSRAGDGGAPSIYGASTTSGVIGVDWDGKPIVAENDESKHRPPPVITSLEIDEGMGELSRSADISIKVFTLGQLNVITKFFMEPGFTLFIEMGWNTVDSLTNIIQVGSGMERVKSQIKDRIVNFNEVLESRSKTNGQYECYPGFITGGSVSADDSGWVVSVKLRGIAEVPYWMQSGKAGIGSEVKPVKLYKTDGGASDGASDEFRKFFNECPSAFQVDIIKKNKDKLDHKFNFINFNEKITEKLNKVEKVETGVIRIHAGVSRANSKKINIPDQSTLIGEEKFVKFSAIIDMVNLLLDRDYESRKLQRPLMIDGEYEDSTDNEPTKSATADLIKMQIDISETAISGFLGMFSTDRSKLLIPNKKTIDFSFSKLENIDSLYTEGELSTYDNSFGGIMFPWGNPLKDSNRQIKAEWMWGWIGDLYVNFNLFKNVFNSDTFVYKDSLYKLLNELSSAVGSLWDFQLVEQVDKDGRSVVRIVDMNLSTELDSDSVNETKLYKLEYRGTDSIFTEASFNMEIGGAMMNQIIGNRISGKEENKNSPSNPGVAKTGLFSKNSVDLLKQNAPFRTAADTPDETATNDNEEGDSNVDLYFNKIGIYPNPLITNINLDRLPILRVTRETQSDDRLNKYLLFATFEDKPLFDKIREVVINEYVKKNEGKVPSPLLPISFSFTIDGISGFKRGDRIGIDGIPSPYNEGIFQITSIKHSVSGMKWQTNIEARYRNIL